MGVKSDAFRPEGRCLPSNQRKVTLPDPKNSLPQHCETEINQA